MWILSRKLAYWASSHKSLKISDVSIGFVTVGRDGLACSQSSKRPTMVFNNQSKVENDPLREQRVALFNALNLT